MTYMTALQGVDMLMGGLDAGLEAMSRPRRRYHAAADLSRLAGATVAAARRRQAEQRDQQLGLAVMERHLEWLRVQVNGVGGNQ